MPAGMQAVVALVKKTGANAAWDAPAQAANVALAGFPITGFTAGEAVGELQVTIRGGMRSRKMRILAMSR